jgi:hypothetical protein
MLKPYMLCLPLLLMGASCVPPSAGLRSSGSLSIDLPPSELFYASLPIGIKGQSLGTNVIAPGPPAKPFDGLSRSRETFQRSLDCLTAAVYYEARSESEEGQRAVAQVVLNRVRHPAFPNSVCGVVYQGSTRRTGCQFSFTCDGSMGARVEPWAWAEARKVAESALSGHVSANVGLATHYHTTAVSPWWAPSLTRAITVGSHIFYRWRGDLGKPLAFRQRYAAVEAGEAVTKVPPLLRDAVVRTAGGEGAAIHRASTPPRPKAAKKSLVLVKLHRASAVEVITAPPGLEDGLPSDFAPSTMPSAMDGAALPSAD